jgi:hypothetical protein
MHPNRVLLIVVRVSLVFLTCVALVYSFVMIFLPLLFPVIDASLVLLPSVKMLFSLMLIIYGVVILRHVLRGLSYHMSAIRNSIVLLVVACVLFANFFTTLVVQSLLTSHAQWVEENLTWFLSLVAATEFVIAVSFLTAVFLTFRPALIRHKQPNPDEDSFPAATPLTPKAYEV